MKTSRNRFEKPTLLNNTIALLPGGAALVTAIEALGGRVRIVAGNVAVDVADDTDPRIEAAIAAFEAAQLNVN